VIIEPRLWPTRADRSTISLPDEVLAMDIPADLVRP
jgi:hypothetical protein